MHDINGKVLHVGDEITSYSFGLCKIVGVEAEDNELQQGANVRLRDQKNEEFCIRTHTGQLVKVRSWKELAKEALAVQDACNLSGVVNSFTHIIREVRTRLEAEGKGGTDSVNKHPICILFADKIAHLTAVDSIFFAYNWAHDQVGE